MLNSINSINTINTVISIIWVSRLVDLWLCWMFVSSTGNGVFLYLIITRYNFSTTLVNNIKQLLINVKAGIIVYSILDDV